jgi:hypothetical protein
MSNETLHLLDAANKLPEQDQDGNCSELWGREIDRRLAELDAGKATVPWTKARATITGKDNAAGHI